MNNQSPLVPQSSFLERKNQGRTRVMIAVFVALSINGIGLVALLMQGCQKPPETTPAPPEPTNVTPAFVEPINTTVPPSNYSEVAPVAPAPAPAVSAPVETMTPPPPAPTTGAEYVVVKGDSFSTLAKKFHVSAKAIAEANPGVDSTKLRIGQTLNIPPAAATMSPATGTVPSESPSATGEQIYKVKSGDNLTIIARAMGTTVKALRAANNLKTDRITVGQKLKIPVKASAPAAGTPATMETAPTGSTGAPTASPPER